VVAPESRESSKKPKERGSRQQSTSADGQRARANGKQREEEIGKGKGRAKVKSSRSAKEKSGKLTGTGGKEVWLEGKRRGQPECGKGSFAEKVGGGLTGGRGGVCGVR